MKTKFSIGKIKNWFRCHNSIYIDHARDDQDVLKYLYRLERLEIIYSCIENKNFNISVYSVNPKKGKINYITLN